MAEQRVVCDLCGQVVAPHGFYVVRIEVYADPSVPPMSSEELAEMDFDQKFSDLIEQMKHLSADDLQDQVHRKFEHRICAGCQSQFIANPLGKPREQKTGSN